jgi:hypothetical protein
MGEAGSKKLRKINWSYPQKVPVIHRYGGVIHRREGQARPKGCWEPKKRQKAKPKLKSCANKLSQKGPDLSTLARYRFIPKKDYLSTDNPQLSTDYP